MRGAVVCKGGRGRQILGRAVRGARGTVICGTGLVLGEGVEEPSMGQERPLGVPDWRADFDMLVLTI